MVRTALAASLALAAFAAPAQAGAPQWTVVADGSAAIYIDRSSVAELTGARFVWVLRNYDGTLNLGIDPVTGNTWYPHRSVKVQYAVDCATGSLALNGWQMFSGNFANGEVVWADQHFGLLRFSGPAGAEEAAAVATACATKTARLR